MHIPWKKQGMLRTPKEAVEKLVSILEEGPERYHGEFEESLEI
jgi:hypothetical protein